MNDVSGPPVYQRDPRIAAHAVSTAPAWLWSIDGTHVLWANAAGASAFGAPNAPALVGRTFAANDPAASQVARIAPTLARSGAQRLERLRGFGGALGSLSLCACTRLMFSEPDAGILVLAQRPNGAEPAMAERLGKLYGDSTDAIAAFDADGALLWASGAAKAQLDGRTTRQALDADAVFAHAKTEGSASGATTAGAAAIERLGVAPAFVMVATLTPQPAQDGRDSAVSPDPVADDQPDALAPPPIPLQAYVAPSDAPDAERPQPDTVPAAPQNVADRPLPATVIALPLASPETERMPDAPGHPAASDETVATPAERLEVPPLRIETPVPDRRHPLRFVWQMDPDGRFTVGSDEFTEVIGPQIATSLGRRWRDVANDLALDPEHQVERAVATRDTWSGITVSWPVDGAGERLKVELSGLPAFDRHRNFLGYRGFGVCRDVDRIATLSHMRRAKPFSTGARRADDGAPDDTAAPDPAEAPGIAPSLPECAEESVPETTPALPVKAQNVVPFRVVAAEQKNSEIKNGELKPPEAKSAIAEVAAAPSRLGELALAAADDDSHLFAQTQATLLQDDVLAAETPAEKPSAEKSPALSAGEQSAFHELARRLNARLNGDGPHGDAEAAKANELAADSPATEEKPATSLRSTEIVERRPPETALFDQLQVGLLVYRFDHLLYANKTFLTWTGYIDIEALRTAGGLDSLVVTPLADAGGKQTFTIDGRDGVSLPYEARLIETTWGGEAAHALVLVDQPRQSSEARGVEAQTALRTAEDALMAERQQAAAASSGHGMLLAKIGRRIRAPLAGIKESAGVVAGQQFGPLGHDRYRDYLADILAGSERAGMLVDNLVRLTDIEAGRIDLASVDVHLNELVQGCITQLQADATRDRVIVRTSLAPALRPVVADAATMKEVLCTLVAHALRLTGPGGQVIISTAQKDNGDVVLHVRDTGIGMSAEALRAALDAFHHGGDAVGWDARSATLALPLAKALAEANQAAFSASSTPNVGTLVEIAFPAKRVLER